MSPEIIPYDEIASFYEDEWISDVLFAVKSGKEATVYCCEAHPRRDAEFYALKLYKPRAERNFRNDAVYHEGRFPRETREVRAIRNKSTKGRRWQFEGWLAHEFATLTRLHEAGCNVPRALVQDGSAILMEFIGADDDSGQPAPSLSTVRLAQEDAGPLFDQALGNIERMLACYLVHADLSAYNILYSRGGGLTIIDVPQAIDPRVNPNAHALLKRDVGNVCRYFTRQGVAADAEAIGEGLWRRFMRAEL